MAISGSLTLLTNLVMAWTTHKLQSELDRRKGRGLKTVPKNVMRHIGPVHFAGINFRGRFNFPIKTYAERVLAA